MGKYYRLPLDGGPEKGPHTWLSHCNRPDTGPYSTELTILWGPHLSSSLSTKELTTLAQKDIIAEGTGNELIYLI